MHLSNPLNNSLLIPRCCCQLAHAEHALAYQCIYTGLIYYIVMKCIAQSSPYACKYRQRDQSKPVICVLGCICRAPPTHMHHHAVLHHLSSPHLSLTWVVPVLLPTLTRIACARIPIRYVHWFDILNCDEMHCAELTVCV